MLFFRLSLTALSLGLCLAHYDARPARLARQLHPSRIPLHARALSVQELAQSRASLEPEEQPFFDLLVLWMNKAREMVPVPRTSPTTTTAPLPTSTTSTPAPVTIPTVSATTPSPVPTPSTTAPPPPVQTPTFVKTTKPPPPPTQPAPVSTPVPVKVAPSPPPVQAVQAPPPPPPPAANGFQALSLATHNDFRAKHGAKPLTWSAQLEDAARKWANNCQFRHSQGAVGPFGENLSIMSGSDNNAAQAIQMWNDEAPDYNPGNPVASHFTQVVWKETTQVGCAVVACNMPEFANGATSNFYVCEYNPAGNVFPASNFAKNVQP